MKVLNLKKGDYIKWGKGECRHYAIFDRISYNTEVAVTVDFQYTVDKDFKEKDDILSYNIPWKNHPDEEFNYMTDGERTLFNKVMQERGDRFDPSERKVKFAKRDW